MDFKQNLMCRINNLKSKMIQIGMEKGLSSEECVTLSQELDKLIYQYQSA